MRYYSLDSNTWERATREILQSWRSVVIMQMQPETTFEWDGLPPMDAAGN